MKVWGETLTAKVLIVRNNVKNGFGRFLANVRQRSVIRQSWIKIDYRSNLIKIETFNEKFEFWS